MSLKRETSDNSDQVKKDLCECGSKSFRWSGEMPCTGFKICMACGKEDRRYPSQIRGD